MTPKLIPTLSLTFLVALSCAAGCGPSQREHAQTRLAKSDFVIIASCDTKGWIEPCGCSSGQSGGLNRRATLAKQLSAGRDSLLVSVGGATSGSKPYDVEKLRAIVAGEAAMGYAVHNIGLEELLIGTDRVAIPGIRFVSTNSSHPDSHSAERWVVLHRAGWRLLVLGVIQPGLTNTSIIEDPETAILDALQTNRNQFDAVIVLAYMDGDSLRELVEKLPEVDVIIGGMTGQSIAPKRIGRTLWTAVSNKGKFIARVTAHSVDDSRLDWSADLHEVTSSLAENPVQQANLKAFREKLGEIDFSADETSFVAMRVSNGDQENHFVGPDRCAPCHIEDAEIWRHSTHAQAWQTLKQAGAHVDPACQQCHTTGFGLATGFVNRTATIDQVNVGCESCHGPSSMHVQDNHVSPPWQAAESCRTCHDHENSPEFEYDSYWEQIFHGTTEATHVAKNQQHSDAS